MSSAASIAMRRPESLEPAAASGGLSTRAGSIAAFALGFFAFLPYPAIPAGNNTAIQIGSLITLAMVVPILLISWKRQPFYLYLLLLIPLCTSAIKVAVTEQPGLDTCIKSVLTTALPCLTLLAGMNYAPKWLLQIMTGIAAATILHVLVGCWQEYVFLTGGQFPLLPLYVNPSFLSVAEQANDFVRYEQRPFGLFPEPSAMSSSLAPWVLIWIAELCGMLKFAAQPSRRQRMLFTTAAISGLALIISSRSGHAVVTLAAVVLFGAAWVLKARATPRNFLATLVVFGIVLPVTIWLTVLALNDRVSESAGINQSWLDRSESLRVGLQLWLHGDPPTLLFGIGTGLSAAVLSTNHALDAVWSVLLTYLYETGIVGALVLAWFALVLFRTWRGTRFSLAFATVLVVWLVGITLTTSYSQLLPIWLTLAFLAVWPQPFPNPSTRTAPPNPRPTAPAPPRAAVTPYPTSAPPRLTPPHRTPMLTPWDRDLGPPP